MRKIILDYTDVLEEAHSLTFSTIDPSMFYQQLGWCPYCERKTSIAYEATHEDIGEDSASSRYYSVKVYQCDCGWWDIGHEEWTGHDSVDAVYEWLTLLHGILRRFDLASVQLPIDVLRRVLKSKPDAVDHIHDKKMEELVASVLSDFYPGCTARVCGKSHDGGIDLILVEHDVPIAVQVKRRQRITKTEPVSAVREFLGAMIVEGFSHGIYVTSAHDFSREAKKAAAKVILRDKVARFDLINRDRFFGMLKLIANQTNESWRSHLPFPFAWRT